MDLTNLRGKVVLIDFWATWCGPCVGEVPHVKEAYHKLHSQGFEVIGISLDQDRARLEYFINTNAMPWPQYCDGKGWSNDIGVKYSIHSIPTMWLVDKEGLVQDQDAEQNLLEKAEKLLAEP